MRAEENNLLSITGKKIITSLEFLGQLSQLVGQTTAIFFRRGILDGKILWTQMVEVGVNSLPIVLLIALFTGIVIGLQTSLQFARFGALSMLGGVVALTFARELAPVLTGVVVAGRIGSSFAAELGSMKVTEQIDALRALAVNPIAYLVVPRFLSCLFMLPILVLFSDIVGVLGGFAMSTFYTKIDFRTYVDSISLLVVSKDVLGGLLKAIFFGLIIAIVGCHKGLNVRGGASGVGRATTESVVLAIILIFLSNCIFSALLFSR